MKVGELVRIPEGFFYSHTPAREGGSSFSARHLNGSEVIGIVLDDLVVLLDGKGTPHSECQVLSVLGLIWVWRADCRSVR